MLCIIGAQSYAQLATKSKNNPTKPLPFGEAVRGQKNPLTSEDYKLWSTMSGHSISNNGDWHTYFLQNIHSKDYTLFLESTKTNIKFDYDGYGVQFSADSKWFGCLVREKGLGLRNLENGSTQWIPNISKFEFIADTHLLAYIAPTELIKKPSLLILDLITGKQESIIGVTEYKINSASNQLAYIVDTESEKSVALRTLTRASKTTSITKNELDSYQRLRWSSNGSALIFSQELQGADLEKEKSYKLYYYNDKEKTSKLKYLDSFPEMTIGLNYSNFFRVSEDGSAVYFNVSNKEGLYSTSKSSRSDRNVQVWNTKDKQIYPQNPNPEQEKFFPKLAGWWPKKDKTMLLQRKESRMAVLTIDRKHLLSFDQLAYAPHFKSYADVDFYLTDLETGEHNLFLKKQELSFEMTIVSPGGKYINYFYNNHWWIYDLKQKSHTNVTKGLGIDFYRTENKGTQPEQLRPFGMAGWTEGDKELIVYDKYDVWLISPKGKAQRITQGREKQVHYRIVKTDNKESDGWFSEFESKTYILSEGLVMRTAGYTDKGIGAGYTLWHPKKGIEELVYTNMSRLGDLKKARDKDVYIYTEQSFNTSPRLRYLEKGMSDSKILVETNLQQKQFQWGHSELVRYKGPDGENLKGALFYPANYKVGKKYPMILEIYENKSHLLHKYIPPTEYVSGGFNTTNYTADGYLVFMPDITYTYNDPGISAVRCIEAGVKAVLKKGIVEEDHIGLVGFSFGGYEAAFTVTQTNLFATVIAGGANTNLISNYHSVAFGDGNKIRMYWYEDKHWRFTDSFYENPEAYFRNSPLHHAANINTPLLLWTGGEDARVDWRQSIQLYSGLRRLGKECTLLIYPSERHGLRKPENQVDFTRRMKAWLAKYLKPGSSVKK